MERRPIIPTAILNFILGHPGTFLHFKERYKPTWERGLRPFLKKCYKPAWLWDSSKMYKRQNLRTFKSHTSPGGRKFLRLLFLRKCPLLRTKSFGVPWGMKPQEQGDRTERREGQRRCGFMWDGGSKGAEHPGLLDFVGHKGIVGYHVYIRARDDAVVKKYKMRYNMSKGG